MTSAHLAIDLGASSGRAIIGVLDDQGLTDRDVYPTPGSARLTDGDVYPTPDAAKALRCEELHRFEHHPCPTPFGPVWDLTGIWLNILKGLRSASAWCLENQVELASIGVDAWGVDWCLVGKSGELLGLPHCYRDPQNDAAAKQVLERVGGRQALYQRNGIQFMPFNTVFQVAARLEREPDFFKAADRLLFIPDLFHYWLSGEIGVERTIASTSALLSIETGDWDFELIEQLGLPTRAFGRLIEAGDTVGHLRDEVASASGLSPSVRIISPASHDTAAAVAAAPVTNTDSSWAFLSSGTWSLVGMEIDQPFVSERACEIPFTNERGINGSVRFLKNIAGLWLIQELKRELETQGDPVSFSEMVEQARSSEAFRTIVNPNDSRFASPGNMADKLKSFATESKQPIPETVGQRARCCLDSLALSYRDTVDRLESVLGKQVDELYMVGGGIQNELLNEITASTLERPVHCGPVEATAIGNLLVQAMGCGEIKDLNELRQTVARSFPVKRYRPEDSSEVPEFVFERFQQL